MILANSSSMKYLKSTRWYHGTTLEGWKNICKMGVQVKHNIDHELDFGYGFYLTPKCEQAEKFITTILRITGTNDPLSQFGDLFPAIEENKESKIAVIVEFEFCPLNWVDDFKYKTLNGYDDEFAEFVFFNRLENVDGSKQHSYDFIFGVMSDSNPIIDVARYKREEIGKEEVIQSFKKSTSAKQLSIHNQGICDTIVPSKAYIIETREELNVSDYINERKRRLIV